MFKTSPPTTAIATASTTITTDLHKENQPTNKDRDLECREILEILPDKRNQESREIFKTLLDGGWAISAIANQLVMPESCLQKTTLGKTNFSLSHKIVLEGLLKLPPERNNEHILQKKPCENPTRLESLKICKMLEMEHRYKCGAIANFLGIHQSSYSNKKKGEINFTNNELKKLQEAQANPSLISRTKNNTLSTETSTLHNECVNIIKQLKSLGQTDENIISQLKIKPKTYDEKFNFPRKYFTQKDLSKLKLMLGLGTDASPSEQPPSKKQKTSAEPLTSSSSYSFSLFKDFNNPDRSLNLLASDIPEAEVVDLDKLTTSTKEPNLNPNNSLKRLTTG